MIVKDNKIRTFVAILLPEHVKTRIYQITFSLRQIPIDIKWVDQENYHLTLKFFGNLTKNEIAKVDQVLTHLVFQEYHFFLTYGGWGLFPNQECPRVIWLGLGGDLSHLQDLWIKLENAFAKIGFPREDKTLHPHITLGRIRSSSNIKLFLKKMQDITLSKKMGSFTVKEIHLMESKLSSKGPLYTSLHSYPLR